MKERLLFLAKTAVLFLVYFILMKPVFMLFYYLRFSSYDWTEWFRVIGHGLPLDISITAYVLVIPILVTILSVWTWKKYIRKILQFYFLTIISLLAVIYVSDMLLYSYWGFRLDATPLFYLKSPTEAAASVSGGEWLCAIVFTLLYILLLYYPIYAYVIKEIKTWSVPSKKTKATMVFVAILAFLIIPIRGGVSVSTMNVGKVYFSPHMILNHAAINPVFSFLASISKQQNFDEQYRFMTDEEANACYSEMKPALSSSKSDSVTWIKKNPNVILILLESFSAEAMEKLGGEKGVMPHLSAMADEGIFFTNFYANSFRTDRGLVAVLGGYPAQPTTSIMKYPAKTQSLPSISGELKKQGYDLQFLYGGDADFTNMRSYFVSSSISNIVCDKDFPIAERLSKWGANDDVTFNYLLHELNGQQKQPFMKMFLTLSSHEPFEVPYAKFDNKYLNSVAFTDSCLGEFITKFKQNPMWDNTLIVLLPDHAMHYPPTLAISDPRRYHIPMVWTGGAVLKPQIVDVYGSQIDLAATLLSQMGYSHDMFDFSKNMSDRHSPHFAYYTFKDGFGFLTSDTQIVYDNESNQTLLSTGKNTGHSEKLGKAFLQKLYDDLAAR